METYVPTTSNSGILGGKGMDGELDELQAWKKTMKEREQKGTTAGNGTASRGEQARPEKETAPTAAPAPPAEENLDEIQQFKLIMKRAQEQPEPAADIPGVIAGLPQKSAPALEPVTSSGLKRELTLTI
jgi:zinc finger CCCH domain-containing protein 13